MHCVYVHNVYVWKVCVCMCVYMYIYIKAREQDIFFMLYILLQKSITEPNTNWLEWLSKDLRASSCLSPCNTKVTYSCKPCPNLFNYFLYRAL